MNRLALAPLLIAVGTLAASCGSSSHTAASTTSPAPTTSTPTASAATSTSSANSPGALQAEANAAAAGDIPDNQVFLVFQNRAAGYSMKFPEGWAQQGSGDRVVFRDKNNVVRIVVGAGQPLSTGTVRAELARQSGVQVQGAPQAMTLPGGTTVKVVYHTVSAPNSVTGKRVTLVVDRYYLSKAGRRAVVDLGTPQGVDNVDAYRMMIESFRWR